MALTFKETKKELSGTIHLNKNITAAPKHIELAGASGKLSLPWCRYCITLLCDIQL